MAHRRQGTAAADGKLCVYVSDPHQVTLYRVKIGDMFYYIKIA